MKSIIFIFAMLFSSILFGAETIKELKNDSDTMMLHIDTIYRMGDADSKQSAKRAILEKVKVVASEYAGTYVESHVELTNGRMTKDEIATLSRAFVSQKILKESFKMLPNGFMVLEATVESTLDRKGITDKLETVSKSEENKAKIAQIQADNTKLQSELEEVSKELSSLKDSTAALAQQLFAKREEIYKKLDANDNIVLTKLDKKEVLSQAVQVKQAYDKDMDEFKCKVNANLYILEKILTPKVKSTKVDFDGKNYSLRVVVQLGENLNNINIGHNGYNKIKDLSTLARFLGVDVLEEANDEKLAYTGYVYYEGNKPHFSPNPKALDLNIVLNDKHVITDRIAWYDKSTLSYYKNPSESPKMIRFVTSGINWKNNEGFLMNEFIFTNLSAEDVANLEAISLQMTSSCEVSNCVKERSEEMLRNGSIAFDEAETYSFLKAKLLDMYLEQGMPALDNMSYTSGLIRTQKSGPEIQRDFLKYYEFFANNAYPRTYENIKEDQIRLMHQSDSKWTIGRHPFLVVNFSKKDREKFEQLKNKILEYEQWRIDVMFEK